MKNALMIAFHYPPCRGSSGVHRTLKFSRYLLDYGWRPIILTAHPRAYPQTGDDQLAEIREEVVVKRAFAWDTSRHLSLYGSYARWMALPDRWVSWELCAVPLGLYLIHKYRPEIIWSTFPIATAHLIGLTLNRLTKIPWVVDFRDPMTEEFYPADTLSWKAYHWIERQSIRCGAHCIFTAPSTKKMYLDRYRELSSSQCRVIYNGYDEENFQKISVSGLRSNNNSDELPLRWVHAGLIYREERDPIPLFRVLSKLKKEGFICAKTLRIELRAAGAEDYYTTVTHKLNIQDIVHFFPALPYQEALQDCANADVLLLLQGASCNYQIPAKAYEYIRLKKPILALTPESSDTALLLKQTGGATIIDLSDEQALYYNLPKFISSVRDGIHPLADYKKVQLYNRDAQAFQLSECFSNVLLSKKNLD